MTVTEAARATMESYLDMLRSRGSFADLLADDVTLEMIETGQSVHGRADVEAFIRFAHEHAFDARMELVSLVVNAAGDRAAIEARFVGRHAAEFAGIPATGREVSVPYSVHYELRDGAISALRIYALGSGLVAAISGPGS